MADTNSRRRSRRSFVLDSEAMSEWEQLNDRPARELPGVADLFHRPSSVGTTKVLVVTEVGSEHVVAHYAWCMAHLAIDDARDRLRRGAGRYPQPVALLARLGVDLGHEGNGLGAGLLTDVIARVATLSKIGCRGLLVHAESQTARDFYVHLVPEFEQSPTDPLHLVLLTKDIRRTLTR